LGGRLPAEIGEQVTGEAAVARADGAADGDPRWAGRPHTLGDREERAVGAQREQHLADAPLVQGADGGERGVGIGEDLGLAVAGRSFRACSAPTIGSSSAAGSTETTSAPAAASARETLTPLPPGSVELTPRRTTPPRSSGPGRARVRSRLGLAVRVTTSPVTP